MTQDRDWRKRSKCKDEDIELFFSSSWRDWRKARDICEECPVRKLCMTDALNTESIWGVWGGRDQLEIRRALALDHKGDPRAVPKAQVRCPYCLSHDLSTLEKKRARSLVTCNSCGLEWRRRTVGVLPKMRKETKPSDKPDGDVGEAVSAGS